MESTPMRDITGAPSARPSRNLKRSSYQSRWLSYREAEQENKENIDWEIINKKIPIMNDNYESDDDSGMVSEEPMDIVGSLRACRIRSREAINEAGEPSDEEPVVPAKRARIVKPIEDDTSARKSMAGAQPPSFLQREKENQQRREDRRVYYDMLTKKSNPQPFKARPAPKFKPVAIQTPKKNEPKILENPKPSTSTSISQTTTIVKPVLNQNGEIPLQKKAWVSKCDGDMLERPSSIPLNMRRISAPPMLNRRDIMTASRIPQKVATPQKPATPSPQTSKLSSSATTTTTTTPRRTVTIPKSPQLSTAIRARERRRFEEAMKERERQREHLLKIEQATIQAHERDSVAKLRRSSVHRALPNLSGVGLQPDQPKRPLTHPLLPIFVKRPRWI